MTEHHETLKTALDAASIVTVIGTFMNALPAIAALFTIVWTGIRIYETDTVQKMITAWKQVEDEDAKRK
jgi:FtsH-binding integral membrane protein